MLTSTGHYFKRSLSGKNRWLKKSLGELKSMCIEVSPDGDILLPINTRVTKGRNEVASSIRQKIMDACSDAEVDIPTRWYVFELEVSGKAKKEGRSVLGRAECIEVGGNLSMGEEDVMAALVFLDGAALCLYFPAAAPHLVFTDPQAILSEVTEILNLGIIDLHLIPSQYPLLSEHMALVRRLRDQGLFNKKLVDIVCSKYRVNEEGKCSYSVDDFLAILEHLLIIAPVCIDGEELFIIPSILPTSNKISPLSGKLAPLVLLCRTRVIPLGMFSALVVALLFNELFLLDEIIGRNAVSLECKLGGVVQLVECHAWLTVHYNGHPSDAPRIRAAIHHAIATVCRQRHLDTEQIVFTDGFFCPFKFCESIPHHCEVSSSHLTGSPALLDLRLLLVPALMRECWHGWQRQMVSVADDDQHVSIIVYFFHVASTVSASVSATATPQSPPPTGEMLCFPHSILISISLCSIFLHSLVSFNWSYQLVWCMSCMSTGTNTSSTAQSLSHHRHHHCSIFLHHLLLVSMYTAGVYMLVHNVDVCTAGTDTVSRFQFMETVASKIPAKWKRVGVSLGIRPESA